jgi:CRISPR-associated protein Csb2
MPLVLEIEHLLGISFAARSQASTAPDWPPQPDRVFSALVAAWGARGEQAAERRALEWLETQPAPEIAASEGFARSPATVFVPPNDPETRKTSDRTIMPDQRRRQPRRFPAFRPDDPVVRLVWCDVEADSDTLARLNALAADTPYVGHSASLTRCRFGTEPPVAGTTAPRRRIYAGRLAELERNYRAGRRPNPGEDLRAAPAAAPAPGHGVFSDRWLVLDHVPDRIDSEMPDLRAAALVAKALRNTLMSGYNGIGKESAIPATVSGHAADGSPSAEPHLAIVPLAFLGPRFADGRLHGFALVPPGDGKLLDDETFQSAVRAIAPWKPDDERREMEVVGDRIKVVLTPSGARDLHSLDPAPYTAVARTWATCTPIALDRHLKEKGNAAREAEATELVRKACVAIGLPAPPSDRVALGKHSAINGAPSAYPSGRGPRWTGWRLPRSLAGRQLTHAVFRFDQPVRGPVILGAGRYVGLGLCRPLDAERG